MMLSPLDQFDPRLRQVCATLAKSQLRTLEQQLEIDAMLDYMYGVSNKAVRGANAVKAKPNVAGLSANQVGIMKQICAVDLSIGSRGYTDLYLFVNPRIVWASKTVVERAEGCLNFTSTWGVTRRSRTVRVAALDRSGNEIEMKLTGWPAILVQHEVDHLNGRLFIDRLPDPSHAHLVPPEEYLSYRKGKPQNWHAFDDVSSQAVTLPDYYQPEVPA
jgi:peptide deformylase